MKFCNYIKYFFIIVFLLIGIQNCATFRIHDIQQLDFEENYFFANLILVDFRPGQQKSLNRIENIEKDIPLNKSFFLSGSLCPNKTNIQNLGEKMNKIVDSLSTTGFVEVSLLDYYVRLMPDSGLKNLENTVLAAGVAGLILEGWNCYRVYKELKENEPFSWLMYPIYVIIPHDLVSSLAIGLISASGLALQLLPVVKRKTEAVIAVKINEDEDKLIVKRIESFSFGGKWKRYRVGSNEEVFWGVDIETIREILERVETDFLIQFRDRISKL